MSPAPSTQKVEQQPPEQQQQQQQLPAEASQPQEEPTSAAADKNAQRFPIRLLNLRKGNTEVRNGLCYIMYRSQMDPRWPKPQIIDEKVVDRNRLESVNLQRLNPDIIERRHVKCICARVLDLVSDWYAQMSDGTLVCSNCARCNRCFTLCSTAGRKLNSIDGVVLCNRCMLEYGRYREPRLRLKVQPLSRLLAGEVEPTGQPKPKQEQGQPAASNNQKAVQKVSGGCCGVKTNPEATTKAGAKNAANCFVITRHSAVIPPNNCLYEASHQKSSDSASYAESCSSTNNDSYSESLGSNNNAGEDLVDPAGPNTEVLNAPRFRDEGRRPIRLILYPNPRAENYGRPNYRVEAPPYLAVDRNAGYQVCPECDHQAIRDALVVPGIARVYHEKSFCCASCKRQLYSGYQVTGVQFEGCNCPKQPMMWCTAIACRRARVAHHKEKKCTLEPLHPGGRPMRDVPGFAPRFDPDSEKRKLNALIYRRQQIEKARQEKLRRLEEAEEASRRKRKRG